MVCARLDAQAKALARQYGCVYTRYADDITFSTRSRRFAPAIAFRDTTNSTWVLGTELRNLVESNKFAINDKKTRVRNRTSRQEVTGLRINERLNVSREFIRQVRAMIHAWENYGETAAFDHFLGRFDRKHRAKPVKSFRAVLRGKIEFVGFVRGRDDEIYVKLLTRFLFLDDSLRARRIIVGKETTETVTSQAIWLLLNENGDKQGTAFAIEDGYLLTAAHCVEKQMWASRPWLDDKRYLVAVKKMDEIRDTAQVSIDGRTPVALRLGDSSNLSVGTRVSLLGFPNYHVGDSVAVRHGSITQSRNYIGVPHYLVDTDIVVGNSGGPVLNDKNEVVGIAVKGLSTPGIFSQYDQLSSFVPINLLQHMKEKVEEASKDKPEIGK
jgi:S1-C subfamily serine protease